MKLIVTAIAATALLFGTAGTGMAKSGNAGGKAHVSGKAHVGKTRVNTRKHVHTGAKAYAPGQRAKVTGASSASTYAPGQRMKATGTVGGQGGASDFAPGQINSTTGAGVRLR